MQRWRTHQFRFRQWRNWSVAGCSAPATSSDGPSETGRTGAAVDIEITPEIDAVPARLKAPMKPGEDDGKQVSKVVTGLTFIHRRDGRPDMDNGLCAMLKRRPSDVRERHKATHGPLEQIQALCGLDSITTPERCVKSRWRGLVAPNEVARTV